MAKTHLVVDGSNIATEGRTAPSLEQLDEAVTQLLGERHFDVVTVVVDATFGHRIDTAERARYEEAVLEGELISPPAGAIGRGDAFVLQIANKADATVFSNDSFQEFHGEYPWLFDEGRLIGGKPVPAVGWVFLARAPVRGPASRRSVRQARDGERERRPARRRAATGPPPVPTPDSPPPPPPSKRSRTRRRTSAQGAAVEAAEFAAGGVDVEVDDTLASASEPAETMARNARRKRRKPADPVNDLLPFVEFVGRHPLGGEVDGEVVEFSSHGAYVAIEGTRCYLPLKSMGDPPPRSAREVLGMGEVRSFVVQAIDTPRRGIDLALPGVDVDLGQPADGESPTVSQEETPQPAEEAEVAIAKKAPAKKAAAKKTTAKKAPAKKAAAKRAPAKKAPAKKAAAKRAPAKKAAARKAPAKRASR